MRGIRTLLLTSAVFAMGGMTACSKSDAKIAPEAKDDTKSVIDERVTDVDNLEGHGWGWTHSEKAWSIGNVEKGTMVIPFYRGVAVPLELLVLETPQNDSTLMVRIDWDKSKDKVVVRMHGDGIWERKPSVNRTQGVNVWTNPFWPEQDSYDDGRYQFWFLSSAPNVTLYYNPQTLDLMGSEYDFETPPPAIPVQFPAVAATASKFIQPKANGDLRKIQVWPYHNMKRQDGPWGYHIASFPPTNLCLANPTRLDLSSLRGIISPPQPPEDSPGFDFYYENGMFWDITVEPPEYSTDPPLTQMVAVHSGAAAFGGAVPKGYEFNLDRVFGSVAPPVVPWPGAGQPGSWVKPIHTPGINFCPSMGGQQAMVTAMQNMHGQGS